MTHPQVEIHQSARPALAPETDASEIRSGERHLLFCLFVVTLLLRVLYVFRYHTDTDEPQHLHVVWGWAHGLLQYRDVFDNHMPLFHMLTVPLFRAVGERPDVVVWMRLPMIPLYALSLGATFWIGRSLYSRRAGLWAALIAGLFPSGFFRSLEFRPDDLWMALWLLAIGTLVAGPLTWRRSLAVGFLLGAAVGVSIKTALMLAALAISLTAVALLRRGQVGGHGQPRPPAEGLARCATAMLAGFSVVPLALAAFFASHEALGELVYGVILHNVIIEPGFLHRVPLERLTWAAMVPFLLWGAPAIARRVAGPGVAMRRAFVFVTAGAYLGVFYGLWPIHNPQDLLPLWPLLGVLVAPPLLALPGALARLRRPAAMHAHLYPPFAAVAVVLLEIAALFLTWSPERDGAARQRGLLEDVLRLTGPKEFVMDRKGETVFRPRPYHFVLESITLKRIRRGLLPDDIARALVETRTAVVLLDAHYPPEAHAFIERNYLDVGRLRVAGRFLPSAELSSAPFEVEVPSRYAIVAERGTVAGRLDGTPYDGPRYLEAGPHQFEASSGGEGFALIWAQAVERGFSPFRSGSSPSASSSRPPGLPRLEFAWGTG